MDLKTRCKFILDYLEKEYPDPPIPLSHQDPYTLLVAVLLSARSTDARVNQISPKLFALANTPEKMAVLEPQDIQPIIRPCGLSPFKSKAIIDLSKILTCRYNGKVPASFEDLESFPGVGHKTASVVMAQAFNVPAFPVDTHIYRLAHRWELSAARSVQKVEADLKKNFPKNKWIRLHLQIIYYAREHCQARKCFGLTCSICKTCFPNRTQKIILT